MWRHRDYVINAATRYVWMHSDEYAMKLAGDKDKCTSKLQTRSWVGVFCEFFMALTLSCPRRFPLTSKFSGVSRSKNLKVWYWPKRVNPQTLSFSLRYKIIWFQRGWNSKGSPWRKRDKWRLNTLINVYSPLLKKLPGVSSNKTIKKCQSFERVNWLTALFPDQSLLSHGRLE